MVQGIGGGVALADQAGAAALALSSLLPKRVGEKREWEGVRVWNALDKQALILRKPFAIKPLTDVCCAFQLNQGPTI